MGKLVKGAHGRRAALNLEWRSLLTGIRNIERLAVLVLAGDDDAGLVGVLARARCKQQNCEAESTDAAGRGGLLRRV
jgi:hypothetical protein